MSLFLPEPIFPVLHLDAALRDLKARSSRARANAVRALPDAIGRTLGHDDDPLHVLGVARMSSLPVYRQAVDGLRALRFDSDGLVRGLAYIARGRLADPSLLHDLSPPGTVDESLTVADSWVQECTIIALAELARFVPEPDGIRRDDILRHMMDTLGHGPPQARFQAVAAVTDAAPSIARDLLGQHLLQETHPEVRAQIFNVLGDLDYVVPDVQEVAASVLTEAVHRPDDPSQSAEHVAAARLLASVGDARSAPYLLVCLTDPEHRDDAIEALAALPSSRIPNEALPAAERLHTRRFLPVVTRIRAAYLIARIDPQRGDALLQRWNKSLRPRVRDAVHDAMRALEQLRQRDASQDGNDAGL